MLELSNLRVLFSKRFIPTRKKMQNVLTFSKPKSESCLTDVSSTFLIVISLNQVVLLNLINRSILLTSIKGIANELVDPSSSSTENEIGLLVIGRDSQPRVKRFAEDVLNANSESKAKEKVLNEQVKEACFHYICKLQFLIFTSNYLHVLSIQRKQSNS